MTARPRLRPGLRRVWRDATTLQVGLSPGPGVVLTGVHAGDEAVIVALDGVHDLDQVRQVASRHQVARRRVDELLLLLDGAQLLVSDGDQADRVHLARLGTAARVRLAPDVDAWSLVHDVDGLRLAAARADRHVVVEGAGRVGAALAGVLAAAGVGTVRMGATQAPQRVVTAADLLPGGVGRDDVGRTFDQAVARAVDRVVEGAGPASAPGPPDLVVLVAQDVLDCAVGDDLVRRGVAHLGVVVTAARIVVGPLVLPGDSPCLRCLDLHRRDRDPAWPRLVAQLLTARAAPAAVGETALSTTAAGLAALQVLGFVDGQVVPDAVGRTLELSLPHGHVQRRSWRWHPGCGCARFPGGADGHGGHPWPTMVS